MSDNSMGDSMDDNAGISRNATIIRKIRQSFNSRYADVNMLRIFSILLVLFLVVVVWLCLSGTRGSSKTMAEVSAPVIAAFENDRAQQREGRILKKYYDLNPGDYEEVVLYFPVTNMDPQELLLIRLKDPAQAESVVSAIQNRQETQKGIYEGYAPEQLALCEQGIIDVRGNYILYVVHEDAELIDQIFRESL